MVTLKSNRILVVVILASLIFLSLSLFAQEKTLQTEQDGFKWYMLEQNGNFGAQSVDGNTIIPLSRGYAGINYRLDNGGFFYVWKCTNVFIYSYGVCNKDGKEIIAPQYDDVWWLNWRQGAFKVKLGGQKGLVDIDGKMIIPCEYDDIFRISDCDELIGVKRGQFEGLMNSQGEMVIPCVCKKTESYVTKDGVFVVVTVLDNHKGVYSAKGEIVVPVLYNSVICYLPNGGVPNGFRIQNDEGYWGYYTTTGNLLVSPTMGFDYLQILDKYEYIYVGIGNRQGFIDKSGSVVIPVGDYYDLEVKQDGTFAGRKRGKWCSFDSNGTERCVTEYVNVQEDKNKQIVAKTGKEELFRKKTDVFYKVYGKQGAVGVICNDHKIIDCEYERLTCDEVGNIYVMKNGYWGAFNCQGNPIIPVGKYSDIYKYKEGRGFIGVKIGAKYGAYGLDGKEIIKPAFSNMGLELNKYGHVFVQKGNCYGMYDKNGHVVIKPEYTNISTFNSREGVYLVERDGKNGLIDVSGKIIIPARYDKINYYNEEYYLTILNGKKGAYDYKGNEIIAPEYESLTYSKEEGFKYKDASGKWISLGIGLPMYSKYFNEGNDYFENKNYKKAAKSYKKALEYKQTPEAYFNVGVSYYNLDKYDDAITYFQSCLNSNPNTTVEERAQSLISESRRLIAKKQELRQEIAATIIEGALAFTAGVVTASIGANDPNYAAWQKKQQQTELEDIEFQQMLNRRIQQTKQEEYEEYMMCTGGKISIEEWRFLNAQAAWNEAHGNDNGFGDDNMVNENEYNGKLSPDQYQARYRDYEKSARDYYNYLTNGGVRGRDNNGNVQGKTVGQVSGGGYVTWKQGLSKAQANMKRIREEAARYGVHIQQSQWETATAGY